MLRKKPPANGATLAALRFREGWPQQDLAAEHGLSGSGLSKLESGDTQLDRERLDAMAATMDLPPKAVDRQLAAWHEIEDLRKNASTSRPRCCAPSGSSTRLWRDSSGRWS